MPPALSTTLFLLLTPLATGPKPPPDYPLEAGALHLAFEWHFRSLEIMITIILIPLNSTVKLFSTDVITSHQLIPDISLLHGY